MPSIQSTGNESGSFFSIIGIYPPGTLVELDTKEVGLVTGTNTKDIKRPHLKILYDKKGEKLKTPIKTDLTERDIKGNYRRTIVRTTARSDKFESKDKLSSYLTE